MNLFIRQAPTTARSPHFIRYWYFPDSILSWYWFRYWFDTDSFVCRYGFPSLISLNIPTSIFLLSFSPFYFPFYNSLSFYLRISTLWISSAGLEKYLTVPWMLRFPVLYMCSWSVVNSFNLEVVSHHGRLIKTIFGDYEHTKDRKSRRLSPSK